MKVWVVIWYDYEESRIRGVYADREAAQVYVDRTNDAQNHEIEEHEVIK